MKELINKHYINATLIFILLFSSNVASAQNNNVVSINYGFGWNTMLTNSFEEKDGYSNDRMYSIGAYYQHNLSETFALKTGLEYRKNSIKIAAGYNPDAPDLSDSWDTDILTLPVFINYQPSKYIFIEGGPLVDFQFNIWDNQPTNTQSGVGVGVSIGGIYKYKNIVFTLSPFFNYHAIIQFEPDNKERLAEMGARFGIGYQF